MATDTGEVIPPPPPGAVLDAALPTGAVLDSAAPTSEGKKTESPGLARRAYDFLGGRTGIGATGAGLIGAALAPETGFMSLLIPALMAGGGGAIGAATEGKSPLKEGLQEGLMQGAFGGAAKLAPGIPQLAKNSLVKMFASRPNAAEAGEGLMKRLFMGGRSATSMYDEAKAMAQVVAPKETLKAIDAALSQEGRQVASETSEEITKLLKPFEKFYTPSQGFKVAQPVSDMMTEIRRLGKVGRTAKDSEVSRAAYGIREAMLQDLENSGAGMVRTAGTRARKEAAFEKLSDMIAKSEPLSKISALERKDSLFKGAFSATEKEQIDRIVKKISQVAPTGGSGVLGRIATTGLGAALGLPATAVGGPAIGGLIGHYGAEYIRDMLASPAGRKYIEQVLDAELKFGTGRMAGNVGAATGMVARGLASRPSEENQ